MLSSKPRSIYQQSQLARRSPYLNPDAKKLYMSTLGVFCIFCVCMLAYGYTLNIGWVAIDTLMLVKQGASAFDGHIVQLLVSKLALSNFYRPISVLSYSWDFLFWGLNPAGYHLTNIFVLFLNGLLTAEIVRNSITTKSNLLVLVLTASLVVAHPILIESIPAIARRQDALSAVFGLAAILIYLKVRGNHKTWHFVTIGIFLVLSYAAKEVGIIYGVTLLVLIITDNIATRHITAPGIIIIVFATAAWFVLIRPTVTNFLPIPTDPQKIVEELASLFVLFFRNVIYPYDFLGIGKQTIVLACIGVTIALLCLTAVMFASHIRNGQYAGGIFILSVMTIVSYGIIGLSERFDDTELRTLYTPAISYSGLLSVLVLSVAALLAVRAVRFRVAYSGLMFPLLILVYISMRPSPLLYRYTYWQMADKMLTQMLNIQNQAANKGVFTITYISPPYWISPSDCGQPFFERTAVITRDASLQSWLDLTHHDKLRVVVETPVWFDPCKSNSSWRIEANGDNVLVHFHVP